MLPKAILKKGKELSVQQRHPWLFSGAIESVDDSIVTGDAVRVCDSNGSALATGTFSKRSGISIRIFSFSDCEIDKSFIENRIRSAHERRLRLGFGPQTCFTGYRVVFGESDGLPGIIVDRYGDLFVLQLGHAGADRLRGLIVDAIQELFSPRVIVERSDLSSRKEDGLSDSVGILVGECPDSEMFTEGKLNFRTYPLKGQKTGFFLDQRPLRTRVSGYALNATVLNLFSYSGAFAAAALKGSAKHVTNVDSSESALSMIQENLEINALSADSCDNECADVFQWLSREEHDKYALVIADPPALIKKHSDIENGRKAYHFLARASMRMVDDSGTFVMSSCSQYFSLDDMMTTLRRASSQAGVACEILEIVTQPPDHPILATFPESWYLKSAICRISRN